LLELTCKIYSMPKIIIHTNIKNEDIPDDFEEKVAQKVSEVVGYPIEIIYVSVTPGDRMIHNGSRDPMAFVDIDTALKFNEEVNPGYTVKFQEFFTKALNIPLSRLVLHYHDAKVSDYGVYRRAPEYKHEQYFSQ
ncbi:macrophage factor migration inhibitory, partial [Mytilus galloprovincialis]